MTNLATRINLNLSVQVAKPIFAVAAIVLRPDFLTW